MNELFACGSTSPEDAGNCDSEQELLPFFEAVSATDNGPEAARTSEKIDTGILPDIVLIDRRGEESDQGLIAANQAIHDALAGANDTETVVEVLKGRDTLERQRMNLLYEAKYGISLKEAFTDNYSGAQLEVVLNLMGKVEGAMDYAGCIHLALLQHSEADEENRQMCERRIRDTLAVLDASQSATLLKDFNQRYGSNLEITLAENKELSEGTRETVKIYLKGTDRRSLEDQLRLSEIALEGEDLNLFQEIFRQASPLVRESFLNNDGTRKMDDAFSGKQLLIAEDYARYGQLKTSTKILMAGGLDDNEESVEQALADMPDPERESYRRGMQLCCAKLIAPLTPADCEAIVTYAAIQEALESLGNDDEVMRWQDMALFKGGSLISRLDDMDRADDDEEGVYKIIENLSQEEWQHLKDSTIGDDYRTRTLERLGDFLDDGELQVARDLIDQKIQADNYQDAYAVSRPILDTLTRVLRQSLTNLWSMPLIDDESVLHALKRMTPAERNRYVSDPQFKENLDSLVSKLLCGDELDIGESILEAIAKGKRPEDAEPALITNLLTHASQSNTDEAGVIRDLQKALSDDKTIRDRLNNPQTADDVDFASHFNEALLKALDEDEFERYARPLLETGHLPIHLQLELDRGTFDDDELGAYKDILNATTEEKKKIETDIQYREEVIGFLNTDEQAIALNILTQAEIRPEDNIRMHVVGAGTGEKEILATLENVQFDSFRKNEYARKYGVDIEANLIDELGGLDKTQAVRLLRNKPADALAAFDEARPEYYASRGGKDQTMDDTGALVDDAFHKLAALAADRSAVPGEMVEAAAQNLNAYLDIYRRSKANAADKIVDMVLLVASLVTPFSLSLPFLLRCGMVASLLKVCVKSSVMGADYDWASQAGVDFGTGFVDGVAAGLGSGHLASACKVAETGANTAARLIVEQTASYAAKSQSSLRRAVFTEFYKTLTAGTTEVSQKSVSKLATGIAGLTSTGSERACAEQAIISAFKAGMAEEVEHGLKVKTLPLLLAAGTGAASLTSRTVARALPDWDSDNGLGDNLLHLLKIAAGSAPLGAIGNAALMFAPPLVGRLGQAGITRMRSKAMVK